MAIIQTLEKKQAGLRILNSGMDTQTPIGKLMLTVLGGVAQFEREIMLERQREGVANGVTITQIARQLNIGEASIYRILADNKKG